MRTKIILAVSLIVAAACGLFGQSAPPLRFEVASIKANVDLSLGGSTGSIRMLPGGQLSTKGTSLWTIIQYAYGVRRYQIFGGPNWINSDRYDIEAKRAEAAAPQQVRLMTQALLEERFKLKVHREERDLPVYDLTIAKVGLKLPSPREGSCVTPTGAPPAPPTPGQPPSLPCGLASVSISPSGARMFGGKVSMTGFIATLSSLLGRTVIDKTGFTGTFDLDMTFTPDLALEGLPSGAPVGTGGPPLAADPAGASIFTAIQEQLGLKLDSGKGPVEVLVIDSAEKPAGQ